jgi:hypothetical protein
MCQLRAGGESKGKKMPGGWPLTDLKRWFYVVYVLVTNAD